MTKHRFLLEGASKTGSMQLLQSLCLQPNCTG